nr:hypothetical protein CFP56_64988 [Quercus suber]
MVIDVGYYFTLRPVANLQSISKGSMLEDIKLYFMRQFQENKETILKVVLELYPKVRKRLYKEKLGSSKWLACWAGHAKFELCEVGPSGRPPTSEPNQTSTPPTTSQEEFPSAPSNSSVATSTPS